MPKKEKTLISVGPQYHTFLAVTGALVTAAAYGKRSASASKTCSVLWGQKQRSQEDRLMVN
jgi:hypothetical protein